MADIKQAAKWMQEGKKVRRRDEPSGYVLQVAPNSIRITDRDGHDPNLWADDLLSDDWEIAE